MRPAIGAGRTDTHQAFAQPQLALAALAALHGGEPEVWRFCERICGACSRYCRVLPERGRAPAPARPPRRRFPAPSEGQRERNVKLLQNAFDLALRDAKVAGRGDGGPQPVLSIATEPGMGWPPALSPALSIA